MISVTILTKNSQKYRIEIYADRVRFLINGLLVAENFKTIPDPYELLTSSIRMVNGTSVGSSTQLLVDFDCVQNFNKIMIGPVNDTDPAGATTNDLETLVDLMTQLLSRASLPDPLARTRATIDAFAGTVLSTGTGAGGAGIPRVTVSSDSSLAANQSVNISQINAVTPLMGTGLTGTGSPRVTLATPTIENLVFSPGNLSVIYNAIAVS